VSTWNLACKECGKNFTFGDIADTFKNFFFAEKPEFPVEGLARKCPHCGSEFTYLRNELIHHV